MVRYFTLTEASALLPEARRRIEEVAVLSGELRELLMALQRGADDTPGGIPEAKALEARVHEGLEWFTEHGVQVKGVAPALLDFPARVRGEDILLCWLQGEEEIGWYHRPDAGFLGRASIAELGLAGGEVT